MDEHRPVLLQEVIKLLLPAKNRNFIDCTVGLGGHAEKILEKTSPSGILVGIDQDRQALEKAKERLVPFKARFKPFWGNFTEVGIASTNIPINGGILADLGVSSLQLDLAGRGFSFLKEEFLDMRMNRSSNLTASMIVNEYSQKDLTSILREYGDENFAVKISKEIIRARKKAPIMKTTELAEIVKKSIPRKFWPKKIHPATKTFQAIRIAVNDELNNLELFLPIALDLLEPGARIGIISFHSGEDRIVKKFLKHEENPCTCPPEFPLCQCNAKPRLKIINKKAIFATKAEITINPRSRSARLRVAEKI